MATLTNCKITFFTHDEDKDHDTNVTVTVKDDHNITVAELNGNLEGFPNHSTRGPYDLVIRNAAELAGLQRGNVSIDVTANGNDTWRFSYDLDLIFSDGSHLSGGTDDEIELTQNNSGITNGLAGMIGSVASPSNPLKNATISFQSIDGKDNDTFVTVTVRDSNNVLVARLDGNLGGFGNNSNTNAYPLQIRNQSEAGTLDTGVVTIRIFPNGHDTWTFKFDLDLTFADNSQLSGSSDRITLSQDQRSQTLGLQGVLRQTPALRRRTTGMRRKTSEVTPVK